MNERAIIIVTDNLPPGSVTVGGAFVLPPDDELIGFAVTATPFHVSPADLHEFVPRLHSKGFDVRVVGMPQEIEVCKCGHRKEQHGESGCGASDDVGSAIERCGCQEFRPR